MLTTNQLWSPAINNWFPGMTHDAFARATCRQIMDMYRFIVSNSAGG